MINNIAIRNILACAVIAAGSANADELNQTISVEKETQAVEHKADKLQSLPDPAHVTTRNVRLNFSDWAIPASLDASLVTQKPRPFDDGRKADDKRGYVEYGMGNYLNIVGSAGYRLVDTERTRLSLWLQHNSTNGTIADSKRFVADNRISLDFGQATKIGTFSANAAYRYNKFNYYAQSPDFSDDNRQKVDEAGVTLSLARPVNGETTVGYHASIGYNFFGNSMAIASNIPAIEPLKPADEHLLAIEGGIAVDLGSQSEIGLDLQFLQAAYKGVNDYRLDVSQLLPSPIGNERHSITSIKPYYSKNNGKMRLRLGARVDLSTAGTLFRIAPEVAFAYHFSQRLAVSVTATGGNRMNTYHTVAMRNRYINPLAIMPHSYTPIDAELRMNIGPMKGFTISPFIGFAQQNGALIPTVYIQKKGQEIFPASIDTDAGTTSYGAMELRGIKAGVDLKYNFNDIVEVKAGYMYTPQDEDKGYIADDDRAEHSLKASLRVSPISRLDLYASYSFRSGRNVHTFLLYNLDVPDTDIFPSVSNYSLGVVSDLGIGANFRINEYFHVYGQINNLLNRSWQDYYGMNCQKIHFLLGAGVKF